MPTFEPIDMSHSACLRRIAEHSSEEIPRLFKLYGIYTLGEFDFFCGWGMQWPPDAGGAIFHDPMHATTRQAASAAHIRAQYAHVADAHVEWL